MSNRPPAFGGFSDVDATGASGEYASLLDAIRAQPAVREWKERTFAALAPRPGAVLLDLGCGTGEDVLALAGLVAPGGRAIGVDASAEMVAEARRRAAGTGTGSAVEFVHCDAHALALPDDAVDGARVERVLQHLDDPGRAVAELARAVRPGGRVVAAEPDWGTFVIDSDDAEIAAVVSAAAARRLRSSGVGRTLRRLFLEAGLEQVELTTRALIITDRAASDMVFDVPGAVRRAVEDGDLDEAQATAWLESRGLASLTAFMVVGTVP